METINKEKLIKSIAEKTDVTKKEAKVGLEAVLDSIREELVAGNKIQLIGFGSFEVRERAARKGRNPQTGEEIEIPATKVPAFKAGKELKVAVNHK